MLIITTCANGCDAPTSGKSKYCAPCKIKAREQWKANVEAGNKARASRYAEFEALWEKAHQAADQAARDAVPAPIIVGHPSTPLGSDVDPTKESWYVSEGVCGFAWVNFPANTSFGRWALSTNRARRNSYEGGARLWVGAYGQSLTRKEAYARTFAGILREAGIAKVYAGSRLD